MSAEASFRSGGGGRGGGRGGGGCGEGGLAVRCDFKACEGCVGDHGGVVGTEFSARAEEGEVVFFCDALQLCVEGAIGGDASCDGEGCQFCFLRDNFSEGFVAAFGERIEDGFLQGCRAVKALLFGEGSGGEGASERAFES